MGTRNCSFNGLIKHRLSFDDLQQYAYQTTPITIDYAYLHGITMLPSDRRLQQRNAATISAQTFNVGVTPTPLQHAGNRSLGVADDIQYVRPVSNHTQLNGIALTQGILLRIVDDQAGGVKRPACAPHYGFADRFRTPNMICTQVVALDLVVTLQAFHHLPQLRDCPWRIGSGQLHQLPPAYWRMLGSDEIDDFCGGITICRPGS